MAHFEKVAPIDPYICPVLTEMHGQTHSHEGRLTLNRRAEYPDYHRLRAVLVCRACGFTAEMLVTETVELGLAPGVF